MRIFSLRRRLAFALVAATVLRCGLWAAETSPEPMRSLAWLVGGTWIGEVPTDQSGPASHLELRFAWTENQRALRFDSMFVQGGRRSPYTSGMYAWNAARQSYEMFYVDASGSLVEGLVKAEGAGLLHELTQAKPDGTTEPIQVRMTRNGGDAFTNEIFLRKGDAWTKFARVEYRRQTRR